MAVATMPAGSSTARPRRRLTARPVAWLGWGLVAFFFVNLAGVIFSVVVSSLSTTWFGTWLPKGFTTHWYGDAWREFGLSRVLTVTAEVAGFCVAASLLIGVPAAYVLAR